MKKIIVVVLMILTLISSVGFAGCKESEDFDADKLNGGLIDESLETDIDKTESLLTKDWMVIPEDNNQEELKVLVENMYNNANRLTQNLEYRQQKVYADVTTDANIVGIAISVKPKQYNCTVKNGSELYSIECQQDGNILAPNNMLITYANAKTNNAISWKSGSDCVCEVDDYGAYHYSADLTKGSDVEVTSMPIFSAEQEGTYSQTSFLINRNTIQNVTVSHNDEDGYYILDFDIDLSERSTYAEPIKGLEANVDDAKYESVHEHIEIWDSGYYKYFQSVDVWSGKKVAKLTATLDYRTYFSYYKSDCNIDEMFAIDEMRSKLM